MSGKTTIQQMMMIVVFCLFGFAQTLYAANVIAYIPGYIVNQLIKIIKCDICSLQLVGTTSKCKLQNKKSQGGLKAASDDVIQVCIAAEYVFRTYPNLYTDKNVISKMTQLVMQRVPQHIFCNAEHMIARATLSDCRFQIIKAIAQQYCKIRLHHEGASRQQSMNRTRSLYTKYILFQQQ